MLGLPRLVLGQAMMIGRWGLGSTVFIKKSTKRELKESMFSRTESKGVVVQGSEATFFAQIESALISTGWKVEV